MLTERIGVSQELVTKESPLLNIHKDRLAEQEAIHKVGLKGEEDSTSINNNELEEIDTYLDQEEFYYCKQPKSFYNFYAKEPQNGDVWYPELDDYKVELDEYPLVEEYDDQLHREILTRGDMETIKKWLEQ